MNTAGIHAALPVELGGRTLGDKAVGHSDIDKFAAHAVVIEPLTHSASKSAVDCAVLDRNYKTVFACGLLDKGASTGLRYIMS